MKAFNTFAILAILLFTGLISFGQTRIHVNVTTQVRPTSATEMIISYKPMDATDWTEVPVNINPNDLVHTYTIEGLMPNTTYAIAVQLRNSEGTGPAKTGTATTAMEPEQDLGFDSDPTINFAGLREPANVNRSLSSEELYATCINTPRQILFHEKNLCGLKPEDFIV